MQGDNVIFCFEHVSLWFSTLAMHSMVSNLRKAGGRL